MPDSATLILFLVSAIALLLIPGPVVLYTVARSIEQGRRAGLVSVIASGIGDTCHVLAATLGLSAIVLSSALAFDVVRYAGATYLLFLGVRTLLSRDTHAEAYTAVPQRLTRILSQGVVVSILNPKTALFFLAFLPQFVRPDQGNVTYQVLVLGMIFVIVGMGTNTLYALLAGAAGLWFRGSQRFRKIQSNLAGWIYIALGISAALSGPKHSQP